MAYDRKTSINRDFVIEKGIPLPDPGNKKTRNAYPFPEMEVGDSFIICNSYTRLNMQVSLSAARSWKAAAGHEDWEFAARKTDDGKVRIWRTK